MNRKNILKLKKRRVIVLIVLVIILVLSAGCGSSKDYSLNSEDSYYSSINGSGMENNELSDENADISSTNTLNTNEGSNSLADSRKLIKNYYIDAESKEFDNTLDSIYGKIEELGGYIENSEISGNSYSYDRSRYAHLVIRIPAEKMAEFVDEVKVAGNVTSYREEVTDITLDYVDTKSHIEALETERDTLIEMLEQSGDLETLLAIQNELTNVRYELEFYESAIRTYDQQVSYGTITLYLDEVVEITEQIGEESFFEELSRRFADSVEDAIEIMKELIIILVCLLPFFLPVVILAAVVIIIIVSIDKSKRKKADKKIKKAETEERNNKDSE